MKGTEKQIAWVEDIKMAAFDTCKANIELNEKRYAEYEHPMYKVNADCYKIVNAILNKMMEINADKDASWWIDHRGNISSDSIVKVANRFAGMITSGKTTTEQIAEKNGVRI